MNGNVLERGCVGYGKRDGDDDDDDETLSSQ